MAEDEMDVRATCEAFGRAMQAMDFDALDDLWDRENPNFVYQPEEYERPCRNWEEFQAYLSYIPGAVESVLEWREIESDVAIIGDAAIVYSVVHLSFDFKGVDEPLEGDARFTFGLRRVAGRWRLFHCHESRQTALDDPESE